LASANDKCAEQQRNVTESEVSITVQSNQGKADYARAVQQAAQIRALAEAEAEKIARTGIAQAIATEEQVAAYGGPQYQVTQQVMNRFAEAVQQSRVDVVPRVVVGGNQGQGGASGSSIMEGLLTLLLSDKLNLDVSSNSPRKASEEVERLRQEIRQSMAEKPASETDTSKQ
jgi:ribosomal protein S9